MRTGTAYRNKPRQYGGLTSRAQHLALGELETLAGFLLPVFFAFLDTRIPGQKTCLFQRRAQSTIGLEQAL